jgi:hypothetical protein
MPSGLPPVSLSEHSSDTRVNAKHIIGVDESGNSADGPFVVTAVQCPRSSGEQLAEILIELDLDPWRSKSSSKPEGMTNEELTKNVEQLLEKITGAPISWHATACWGSCQADRRAMAICILSTRALVKSQREYEGNAVIMHDGRGTEFGNGYIKLRRAAREQFQGFGERETPVYLTTLDSGDRIYPEITAADYISGLLRSEIQDRGIEPVQRSHLDRLDRSWSAPSDSPPEPEYDIRRRTRRREPRHEDRAAAWIEGRRPPADERWGDNPLDTIVSRLESETVRRYLLNGL